MRTHWAFVRSHKPVDFAKEIMNILKFPATVELVHDSHEILLLKMTIGSFVQAIELRLVLPVHHVICLLWTSVLGSTSLLAIQNSKQVLNGLVLIAAGTTF